MEEEVEVLIECVTKRVKVLSAVVLAGKHRERHLSIAVSGRRGARAADAGAMALRTADVAEPVIVVRIGREPLDPYFHATVGGARGGERKLQGAGKHQALAERVV